MFIYLVIKDLGYFAEVSTENIFTWPSQGNRHFILHAWNPWVLKKQTLWDQFWNFF